MGFILDTYAAGQSVRRAASAGLIVAASAGASQGPPNIPAPDYGIVQPALATAQPTFRENHHDHQYTPGVSVFSFDGFDIAAARAAISEHDTGVSFYRSSLLSVALTRFAPVAAALSIRVAPSIALARQIKGGTRGLAKKCADEVRAQLCPSDGLLPSECFPSTLWGALAIEAAMMGFAVMQHVYGPADATGRRRIYTRRWPTWAVRYDSWRRTYVAITTEAEIDICDDGKFTIIGKTDVPHLQGAVRALAFPVLDGAQVQQARAQWINRYSDPKLIAYMPKGVQVDSPEGRAFMRCLLSLRNPGGMGVLPDGSNLDSVGLESKASTSFKEAYDSDEKAIFQVMAGIDPSGGSEGVYTSPLVGDILTATSRDDLAAQNRAVNKGHVHPFLMFNYSAAIEIEKSRGTWVDPVLSTPLPDPDADARIDAKSKHLAAFCAQVVAEKAAGGVVDTARVAYIASLHEVDPFLLVQSDPFAVEIQDIHITEKIVAPDEVRKQLGLDPLPDGVGGPEQLAIERASGKDKAGAKATGAGSVPVPSDPLQNEPAEQPAEPAENAA